VTSPLRIGNAQGFWGDRGDAPAELVAQAPDLDVLTLDYLAEVSLSIMAVQRDKDPAAGFARDFLKVVQALAPVWKSGRKLKLVTNAGGLDPTACAKATIEVLQKAGVSGLKVGVVTGDDVLPLLKDRDDSSFRNWETESPISEIRSQLVAANAYIGAEKAAEALDQGADIVICGRLADPSMAVAPCMSRFGWKADDYDKIAGATVAGHVIECGTQSTGGFFTDWLKVPGNDRIGFPIVEVSADGSFVVTKPANTGGIVTPRTVKEQLLYEIGDPGRYLSPDATVSFLDLTALQDGKDRVRVAGAKGTAPPDTYKVSASYRAGFRVMGMLTIVGRDAVAKAKRAGEVLLSRLERAGMKPARAVVECLGSGDAVSRVIGGPKPEDLRETVMRICIEDPRKEVCERLASEIAPLVTAGPQGVTGYAEGRPNVRPVFGYWPCLVKRDEVELRVVMMAV
jgi:hypothetical protein